MMFSISTERSFRKALLVEVRSLVCPICQASVVSYENTILVDFVPNEMVYYDFVSIKINKNLINQFHEIIIRSEEPSCRERV